MTKTRAKKKAAMTLELEREVLAELKAAVIIFGAKSYSSLIHQQVVAKIREAKGMVSKEEFERLRDEQLEDMAYRSRTKSEERKKRLKTAEKTSAEGEEIIENFEAKKKSEKPVNKNSRTITTGDGETLRFIEEDEGFDNKQ